MATTSALMVRVAFAQISCGAAGALAVVAAGFAVSLLGASAAGFAVVLATGSSVAGATGVGGELVNAANGLSTAVAGVCAPAITAVSKQKVITVNEVTMETGDLDPSIFTLLIHVCRDWRT
jgi:hypothetical protein